MQTNLLNPSNSEENVVNDEKVVAVVGATGAQGGGLVRAILADPAAGFRVRALTRNPTSEKAESLAAQGVEVVRADLDDRESLERALEGAGAAFFVTNFWEHFSPAKEIEQARNLATAAKNADVAHVIWSTLEDTRRWVPLEDDSMPTLMEQYKVPHMDAKGEADDIFREMAVPTTFLRTSFYWDNLIYFGMHPQRGDDGVLSFVLPMADAKLPGIAAEDIGASAFGILKAGDTYIGKTVGISGGHLTGEDMAASLTKALGEPVQYTYVPPEVYRTFDFPGAEELGNMFQVKRDFQEAYLGARDLDLSRTLNPGIKTFDDWLETYGDQLPRDATSTAAVLAG